MVVLVLGWRECSIKLGSKVLHLVCAEISWHKLIVSGKVYGSVGFIIENVCTMVCEEWFIARSPKPLSLQKPVFLSRIQSISGEGLRYHKGNNSFVSEKKIESNQEQHDLIKTLSDVKE